MIKEVSCWFGDTHFTILVDDVDEDLMNEEVCEIATEILLSNLRMEVINGEENYN